MVDTQGTSQQDSSLQEIISQAEQEISAVQSIPELEQVKARFVGKKGLITAQMQQMAKLPPEEKPKFGARVNEAKKEVFAIIEPSSCCQSDWGKGDQQPLPPLWP